MSLSDTIVAIFDDVSLTKYFSAIGFTVVVYDTCLTLADEVRLLWPGRLTLVKALFYINRLLSFAFIFLSTYHLSGIAPSFSDTFCQVLLLTTGYGAILSFAITNWLLLSRACALWRQSKKIVWIMTLFYLITYVGTITTATLASLSIIDDITYSPFVHICVVLTRPNTFGAIWVPSIVFDIVLFTFLFIKLFQHARQAGTTSKLVYTLHRDGLLYFIIILGLRIFNLIAWAALRISLIFIGFFLLWSTTTVLLTRMHLNLKAIVTEVNSSGEDLDVGGAAIEFNHSVLSNQEPYELGPIGPLGKKRRRRDVEGNIETNIFPGGTRIDIHEFEMYRQEASAVTRPEHALQSAIKPH